jgi:hypothetical protein
MTQFDLNDADTGGGGGGLIPAGTVARAGFLIRPGGAGDGGLFKTSRSGDLMLDVEWTILEGPFAKRKVWDNMMVTGSEKAVAVTKKTLRALVEGHYGIRPDDMSENAKAARRVNLANLSGFVGCISIGIESQEGYEPKNRVKFLLTPGEDKFLAPGQIAPTPAATTAPAQGGYGAPPAAGGYGAGPATQGGYTPPPAASGNAGAPKPNWA